ncbi:hypothetical protein EON65_33945 [archaeon]|nr:MAG: hypothetical protein EON65_33945 [archaeon]
MSTASNDGDDDVSALSIPEGERDGLITGSYELLLSVRKLLPTLDANDAGVAVKHFFDAHHTNEWRNRGQKFDDSGVDAEGLFRTPMYKDLLQYLQDPDPPLISTTSLKCAKIAVSCIATMVALRQQEGENALLTKQAAKHVIISKPLDHNGSLYIYTCTPHNLSRMLRLLLAFCLRRIGFSAKHTCKFCAMSVPHLRRALVSGFSDEHMYVISEKEEEFNARTLRIGKPIRKALPVGAVLGSKSKSVEDPTRPSAPLTSTAAATATASSSGPASHSSMDIDEDAPQAKNRKRPHAEVESHGTVQTPTAKRAKVVAAPKRSSNAKQASTAKAAGGTNTIARRK